MAPLAFDGNVPPPLAIHEPHAAAIVVDSVNKAAWAGLRLGWVRADAQLVSDLRSSRGLADLFSPIPSQLMALALLEDLEHVRRLRIAQLASRAAVLREAMVEHLPDWDLAPIHGGLCAWARLPHGSATHVAQVAARHGVSIASGRAFATSPEYDDHIQLPFTAPEDVLRTAIARLGTAWRNLPRTDAVNPAGIATIV